MSVPIAVAVRVDEDSTTQFRIMSFPDEVEGYLAVHRYLAARRGGGGLKEDAINAAYDTAAAAPELTPVQAANITQCLTL